jgi:hypothetical protein
MRTNEEWAAFLTPLVTRFNRHRGPVNDATIGAIVRLACQQKTEADGPVTRPGLEEIAEASEAFPGSDVLALRDFFHGRYPA